MLPVLVLLTAVTAVLVAYSGPIRQVEHKITDQLYEIRSSLPVDNSPIVLVSISQQADQEIPYKYPWPTRMYAKLIENLNKAGAKAIGLDVIFDQPDNYGFANDSLFADALQRYDNVVLAGNIFRDRAFRGGGSTSEAVSLVQPISVLREANKNPTGLVRVIRDIDEGVRRYLLYDEFNGQTYYPLGLELLRIYHGWDEPEIRHTKTLFHFGSYRIPKHNANTMAINYFGGPGRYSEYSFETVIDDSTMLLASEDKEFQINSFSDPDYGLRKEEVFRDKIVLVGATMPELHDFHATPFAPSGTMPGYEIHANVIQTLLTKSYITYAPGWINLLLLLFFSMTVVLVTKKTDAIWGMVCFVLLGLMAVGLVLYGFLELQYIVGLSGPLLAITVGYIATNSYEYMVEQREKRRIRDMFSSYLSPTLVDKLIASGNEPQLGGDEVFVTAFFSDIESFSTFSEQLSPHRLVELINEYLSAMTDILTEEGGTLDKYIGDGIVAFFGAPIPQEAHAYQACIVSQLMQKKMSELRARWKKQGDRWPEGVQHMKNRIGINTGLMITGNMGSSRRFNYTIMGDNVNLAARCESATKSYGVYTMVTEDTKKEAEKFGDRCVFRYLDRIVVKGRTTPVDVYEIMGLKEDLDDKDIKCKNLFEQGIKFYSSREWKKAMEYFRQSLKLERRKPKPEESTDATNPSLVYIDRCRHMQRHPPAEDWNGVYVMKVK